MPLYTGNVTFPSILSVESFSGTVGLGVSPSQFRLTIAPQLPTIQIVGNLVLSYTDGVTVDVITYVDCLVDAASYEFNDSGYLVSLTIIDRRWRWAFGEISGNYNVRNDDGTIVKDGGPGLSPVSDTEKTPQELAILCLDAMGESGYDVAALPDNARPTIDWDYQNPAQALAALCDELGCAVGLTHANQAKIFVLGTGAGLPAGPIVTESMSIDPPNLPDFIRIRTAPVMVNWDFDLEAVGLETDGSIKRIEQLSYKPPDSWANPGFFDVATDANRELAHKSVYRWYRIVVPVDLPPPFETIDERVRILPTHAFRLVKIQDDPDSLFRMKDPIAFGVWFKEFDGSNENSATSLAPPLSDANTSIINRSWENGELFGLNLMQNLGIVVFSQQIYEMDFVFDVAIPARIKLRCAISLRASDTRQWVRDSRTRQLNNPLLGTGDLVVIKDDIKPIYEANHDANYNFVNWSNNESDVTDQCDYYIDAIVSRLAVGPSQSRTYAGIMAATDIDGAIQNISYSIGPGGTYATLNRLRDSGSSSVIPYTVRRALEKQREVQRKAEGTIFRGRDFARRMRLKEVP